MKNLRESKESLDKIIKWCNDNDDFTTAENIEDYLFKLRVLATNAVEHILDLDYSYVKENFDNWDEYLKVEYGITYDDFKLLTNSTLYDIKNC